MNFCRLNLDEWINEPQSDDSDTEDSEHPAVFTENKERYIPYINISSQNKLFCRSVLDLIGFILNVNVIYWSCRSGSQNVC